MTIPREATPGSSWRAVHISLPSDAPINAYLLQQIAASLNSLADSNEVSWFYIRYSEGAMHLRVRVRGLDTSQFHALLETLRMRTDRFLGERGGINEQTTKYSEIVRCGIGFAQTSPVSEASYQPEMIRFGGPWGLALNEQLFCASTGIALRILRDRKTPLEWTLHALDLMLSIPSVLNIDRASVSTFFRAYAKEWERATGKMGPSPFDDGWRQAIECRALAYYEGAGQRQPDTERESWYSQLSLALADLDHLVLAGRLWSPLNGEVVTSEQSMTSAVTSMLVSQMHLLNNRLGLLPPHEFHLAMTIARLFEREQP